MQIDSGDRQGGLRGKVILRRTLLYFCSLCCLLLTGVHSLLADDLDCGGATGIIVENDPEAASSALVPAKTPEDAAYFALIDAYRKTGSSRLFAQAFESKAAIARRMARKLFDQKTIDRLGLIDEAEDVLRELIWKGFPTRNARTFDGYLRRAIRNRGVNLLRIESRKAQTFTPLEDLAYGAWTHAQRVQEQEALVIAEDQRRDEILWVRLKSIQPEIPAQWRQLFQDMILDRKFKNYAEYAQHLGDGTTAGAIKLRMFYLYRAIYEIFREKGYLNED